MADGSEPTIPVPSDLDVRYVRLSRAWRDAIAAIGPLPDCGIEECGDACLALQAGVAAWDAAAVARPAEPERTVRDVLRWGEIDGEYLADLGADLAAGLRVGPEVAARIGRIASRLLEADALLWPDGSGVVGADTMPLDEYHHQQAERDEIERRRAESDT